MRQSPVALRILPAVVFVLAPAAGASPAHAVEHGSLAAIEAAQRAGELTPSQAAAQRLYLVFEPQRLDARFRLEEALPLRCATLLLDELQQHPEALDTSARALLEERLALAGDGIFGTAAVSYETANFYLEYETSGVHAVPLADVSPANGVPDYVERAGEACEYSRSVEVGTLGYNAPPATQPGLYNNKYLVQFQNLSAYGFTTVVSGQRTRIVVENDFFGFPPNDDPDGDQLGALRVTVAHELKHAIQRTYTSWTEGGWVELDATWMEDIVYDQVNDYYLYIFGAGSPFTGPQLSLDNDGFATTGSYEDCNWQHYQTEKLGNAHMRSFWVRRSTFPAEAVMTTYSQNLVASGSSLNEAWSEYVAWNFASGTRAAPSYGYGEAGAYPTTPATSTHASLPVPTTAGSVNRLAANARLVTNPGGLFGGTPSFTFTGSGGIAWQVSVLHADRGTGAIDRTPMTLAGGAGTLELSGIDWTDLEWAALVIGNPATSGGAVGYSFSIDTASPLRIAHQAPWNTTDDAFPYQILASVTAGTGLPDAGAVRLRYRIDGGSEVVVPMDPTATPDEYLGVIPAQPVGTTIEYRIEAESTGDEPVAYPALAGSYLSFQVVTDFEPFETAGAWTVGAAGDAATTGIWERVVPIGTAAQPGEDTTTPPGTTCFVTQNGTPGGALGEADVDGGRTTLLSPAYSLPGGPYASLTARYRRWYSNALGASVDDVWRVDASEDGVTWTNVETVPLGNETWELVTADLLALFGNPASVRFRFLVEDVGSGSLVEAGIDDFELLAVAEEPVSVGEGALAFRVGPAVPNPGAGGPVAFALELPSAARVRACVVDAAGRRVRTLATGRNESPAGSHSLVWDARGEGGARLAAGVYFVTVETDRGRARRKVVLLR
jgi:hypothetical protein